MALTPSPEPKLRVFLAALAEGLDGPSIDSDNHSLRNSCESNLLLDEQLPQRPMGCCRGPLVLWMRRARCDPVFLWSAP